MTVWATTVAALLQTDLAATVTYTPSGGAAASVRAFVSTIEPQAEFGRARARREIIAVEILRSAVAEPTEGATLVHSGKTFTVMSPPLIADPDRLLWRLEAYGTEA